jgi:regulator of RNase E activity RraA
MCHKGLLERHLDVGIRPATPFTTMVGSASTVRLGLVGDESTSELMNIGEVYEAASESPGSINGKASFASSGEPVVIGGQTIHERDMIAADNDGVVVIRSGT